MSGRRDFQDQSFIVEHLRGEVIVALVGFTEGGPRRPQKLLIQLERSGWSAFFLSAFIGHWDHLDDAAVRDVFDDYRDVSIVDYGEQLRLKGAAIRDVACHRDAEGTRFTLRTEVGTLVLREVDGHDPHSESELLFEASGDIDSE